jgi:cell division protein ZapA
MMENRVKVRIIGREYTLITENSTEYTQDLAGKLDSKMNEMLSESKTLSGIDVAILAALDAMDEAAKASENADNIRLQLGEYMTSADKSRQKADSAKKEISALQKRISELEEALAQSETKPAQKDAKPAQIISNNVKR